MPGMPVAESSTVPEWLAARTLPEALSPRKTRVPSATMPAGVVTTAVAAEAGPAVTTLSAAELKRTASAVAVEVLRMRTVMNPHRETRRCRESWKRRAAPGRGPRETAVACGARLPEGTLWHACDNHVEVFPPPGSG